MEEEIKINLLAFRSLYTLQIEPCVVSRFENILYTHRAEAKLMELNKKEHKVHVLMLVNSLESRDTEP